MSDGKDDREHNRVGFGAISKIFAMQNTFFWGTEPFDRFYYFSCWNSWFNSYPYISSTLRVVQHRNAQPWTSKVSCRVIMAHISSFTEKCYILWPTVPNSAEHENSAVSCMLTPICLEICGICDILQVFVISVWYRIHFNKRPCSNRRPPPFISKLLAHRNGWNWLFFIKNTWINDE